MSIKKHLFSLAAAIFLLSQPLWSAAFSGYAGAKLNYAPDTDSVTYNPTLEMQAFIQGQFTFSQNLWTHLEFSIDTKDLISTELFHSTDASFNIDELSLIFRTKIESQSNYFSAFMGTYEPIGSDIFLQRYFGIKPIDSKLTESWLGIAGSILYPHFGIGLSDVVKFNGIPAATGLYLYLNHEDDSVFVFNTDFRTALATRFLTVDFAAGIGFPLSNKYSGNEIIFAVVEIYLHAGTTLLLGNSYTPALFIQAGLNNAEFNKKLEKLAFGPENIYLMVEPRFKIGNLRLHVSAYSLPEDTVEKLMFIDNTLGVGLNFFTDAVSWGSQRVNIGILISGSIPGKNFYDLLAPMDLFNNYVKTLQFDVSANPYISTYFLGGTISTELSVQVMDCITGQWKTAISGNFGYKSSF